MTMKVVKDVLAAVVLAVAAVMVFTVAVRFYSDYLTASYLEREGYRRTPAGWVYECPHGRILIPDDPAWAQCLVEPRYGIIDPKGALVRRYECLP
jgi:hypothetical protein